MYYVYILISQKNQEKYYVGITTDVNRRLSEHNDSKYVSYSNRNAPWKVRTYIAFEERRSAEQFEIYLKSHSGKAFLTKRLL